MATLDAGGALAHPESVESADFRQHLLQHKRVVAAVINNGLAVAVGNARGIGHIGGGDEVAPTHRRRFHAKLARNQVHQAFDHLHRLGSAGTAIGRIGNLVSRNHTRTHGKILHLVRTDEVRGGVVRNAYAHRVPGTAVHDHRIAECQDFPRSVERDFGVMYLVAGMTGALQVLAPVLYPFDRAADAPRQIGQQQILRIDVALGAKAAAHIQRNTAHPRLGHAKRKGDLAPDPVHHLRRRPDRDSAGSRLMHRGDAAAFHRNAGISMMIKAPLQRLFCCSKGSRHVALGNRKLSQQVGAVLFMQHGGSCAERGLRIDDRVEKLVIDAHQIDRILGKITVVGDDHRHRLADVAHLVPGKQGLARVKNLVRHRRAPLARQWQLLILDRRNFFRQLKPAHDKAHARCRGSAAEVDRFDARMRHRTAHECDMQHSGQREIGDVLALPAQQPVIFPARHRLPDKTFVCARARHFSPPPRLKPR